MLILQIETATSVCSCALSVDGVCIAIKEINESNIHAAKITILIGELMEEAGYKLDALDAIAISMGPGSYTGLRIGVSTAKGLCFALDKPLIAVNTLDAMVWGYRQRQEVLQDAYFCPMIDARRMEVYSAIYDKDLNMIDEVSARIIDEHSFAHLSHKPLILFGDGAVKFKSLFEDNKNVSIWEGFENSAAFMGELAFNCARKKQFEDVAYFEPFYLKDFIPTQPKNRK